MLRVAVCFALLLGLGSAFAQPSGPVKPLPWASVPPAWPTLALNANKAPSCVFWTPPVTGATPEYFCAVIVADASRDTDTTLCSSGSPCAGALRAVRVNPTTGAITIGAAGPTLSISLGQDPDGVTCTVIPPGFGYPTTTTVQCLIGSVHRVGWDGTKWWSQPYGSDSTGIQGPGPDPGIQVTSNFSCVPWLSGGTTTCFGLETGQQSGNPVASWIDQWTRDPNSVDWKRPTSPLSAALPASGPDPDRGPLVCSLTAPAKFACVARATTGGLFEFTADAAGQSVTWNPAKSLVTSVATGQSCVTSPSATSTPARTDCFFGDGGLGSGPSGLFWIPDDGSRPLRLAMGESFPLKATPSCIGWMPGQIECFFPDKTIDPHAQSATQADAMIWHVLSYGEDIRTILTEMLAPPPGKSPGFWQENLGVAAPSMELDFLSVGPGSVHVPSVVNNPKTLTSFACFQGPPFQSLCVAGLIDSFYVKVATNPTPAQLGTYRTSRRLVYKLVGNPMGVPPQAPTSVVVLEPPGEHLTKPVGR